ncbi:275_t:CDS:2, partial [Dentiscutata heterogama]
MLEFPETYYFIYDKTKIDEYNTQATNKLMEDLIENNLSRDEAIVKYAQNFSKKTQLERFWHPVTFYFYGEGGAGKSNLVQKLFQSELYPKSKKQKNESSWWVGYQEEAFNFDQKNIDDETSAQYSKSDFCGMIWDLKYDKCKYTTENLKKIVQELNKDKPEEVIIKNNQ